MAGPATLEPTVGGAPLASYTDNIHVTSASLPNRTPVTFQFTLDFEGTLATSDAGAGSLAGTLNVNYGLAGQPYVQVGPDQTVAITNFTAHVGDVFPIKSGFYASAGVNGNAMSPNQVSTWEIAGDLFESYASVATYIDVLTTGATFTTDSGNNYSVLLTITNIGSNSVALSWPAVATGYGLQVNSTLNPATWKDYTGTINTDATNNFVIVSPALGNQFFRLKK